MIPAVPQAVFAVPGLQVPPSQQPLGQLAGVHTQLPFLHSVPAGQLRQAAPPAPQNSFEVPPRQVWVVGSQQPLEQLAVVHTHVPFLHSEPAGHWTQMVPPVPQCWLLLVWQTPFWQQPLGQLVGVHRQAPFWHSRPAAQAKQATPLLPQA